MYTCNNLKIFFLGGGGGGGGGEGVGNSERDRYVKNWVVLLAHGLWPKMEVY